MPQNVAISYYDYFSFMNSFFIGNLVTTDHTRQKTKMTADTFSLKPHSGALSSQTHTHTHTVSAQEVKATEECSTP